MVAHDPRLEDRARGNLREGPGTGVRIERILLRRRHGARTRGELRRAGEEAQQQRQHRPAHPVGRRTDQCGRDHPHTGATLTEPDVEAPGTINVTITVTSTHDFSTAMTRLGTPLTQDDRRVGIELPLAGDGLVA